MCAFPLLGKTDFSAASYVDYNWLQCKAVPKKSSIKAGGRRKCRWGWRERKNRNAVKHETRFAELEGEKGSPVQGIISQGQAAAKIRVQARAECGKSVALMARWFPARWGQASRAPESHFGCQDSLSEPSLQWPEHRDLRGTGAGQASVLFPIEEPQDSLCSRERENLGVRKTKTSAPATVLPRLLCIFKLFPPFGSFKKTFCNLFHFPFVSLLLSNFFFLRSHWVGCGAPVSPYHLLGATDTHSLRQTYTRHSDTAPWECPEVQAHIPWAAGGALSYAQPKAGEDFCLFCFALFLKKGFSVTHSI